MLAHVNKFLKAHAAGLGAAITLALADLNAGHVSPAQWLAVAAAYLGVGAVVAVVPNTPSVEDYPVHPGLAQDDAPAQVATVPAEVSA